MINTIIKKNHHHDHHDHQHQQDQPDLHSHHPSVNHQKHDHDHNHHRTHLISIVTAPWSTSVPLVPMRPTSERWAAKNNYNYLIN